MQILVILSCLPLTLFGLKIPKVIPVLAAISHEATALGQFSLPESHILGHNSAILKNFGILNDLHFEKLPKIKMDGHDLLAHPDFIAAHLEGIPTRNYYGKDLIVIPDLPVKLESVDLAEGQVKSVVSLNAFHLQKFGMGPGKLPFDHVQDELRNHNPKFTDVYGKIRLKVKKVKGDLVVMELEDVVEDLAG
jgi:hypothetical protein